MKLPEGFREAEQLAEFANLNRNHPADVADFRAKYPHFAPAAWWDYKFEDKEPGADAPRTGLCWHETQSIVQLCWENGFDFSDSVFGLTMLLRSVFVAPPQYLQTGKYAWWLPDHLLFQWDMKSRAPASDLASTGLSAAQAHDLVEKAPLEVRDFAQKVLYDKNDLYAFHRAVLFLFEHPWRARICADENCNKYLVATNSQRTLCKYPDRNGRTHERNYALAAKLSYYDRVGKKKRQAKHKKLRQQKQRKTSPRLPVYQPK
ncbi:MAG: hypothetical protein WB985_12275 [Candidatus Acidiferrales bacterium]